MIVFDLKCGNAHVFEAWFGSSTSYAEQRDLGLVSCPLCGDTDVAKALMAPNIASKGNSKAIAVPASPKPDSPPKLSPEMMKAALQTIAQAQSKALETSQWVGRTFADRARAMHAGEEPSTPIHGQSTPAEARALVEEGVKVAPLLIPIVPPEALN